MGVITIYTPGNWSANTQNKLFMIGWIVLGFPVIMFTIQDTPFRVGLALIGFGVAIKPEEEGGLLLWRVETTKPFDKLWLWERLIGLWERLNKRDE